MGILEEDVMVLTGVELRDARHALVDLNSDVSYIVRQ